MNNSAQLPHERSVNNWFRHSQSPLSATGMNNVIRITPSERETRAKTAAEHAAPPAASASAPPASASENEGQFHLAQPLYCMDDVVLNADTREKLETLFAIIRKHDFIYTTWGLQEVDPGGRGISVNFYGPPGTGKTMCAMALAHAFGKKIIDIDYSELESKYVGDTGKNIEAAFRFAREHDAVLFFDEADSILGKRMSQVTQATDHAVNTSRAVMLKALDHYDGIVVFATNLAENFDKAFSRRILSHIEVALPDAPSRKVLWQKFMMPTVPGGAEVDLEPLVEASESMSGGDMKNAFVKACALACLDSRPRLTTAHLLDSIEQVKKANRDVSLRAEGLVRNLAPEEINRILNQ